MVDRHDCVIHDGPDTQVNISLFYLLLLCKFMQIYMISYFSSLEFAQVKLNYSFVVVLYLFPSILWLQMLTMIFCASDEDRYDENWELGSQVPQRIPVTEYQRGCVGLG